jgi:hypothetical protein
MHRPRARENKKVERCKIFPFLEFGNGFVPFAGTVNICEQIRTLRARKEKSNRLVFPGWWSGWWPCARRSRENESSNDATLYQVELSAMGSFPREGTVSKIGRNRALLGRGSSAGTTTNFGR